MAGKFTDREDYNIPQSLLDEADWVIDSFIDSLGKNCTLIYPPKVSECPNCIFDVNEQRSSNIYKDGGPYQFSAGSVCPMCGGEGRSTLPQEETIKLRVYWSPRDWIKLSSPPIINIPNAVAQIIGYMNDLSKLERAESIVLDDGITSIRRWTMKRSGQAIPWGFQRRYFVQFLERITDVA
jgi:hypothetical protein